MVPNPSLDTENGCEGQFSLLADMGNGNEVALDYVGCWSMGLIASLCPIRSDNQWRTPVLGLAV